MTSDVKAEKYFRAAIEKDPLYASAYAGLAECRIPLTEAKASALKAVELDPTSGETHTALGRVQLFRELDVVAAEASLEGTSTARLGRVGVAISGENLLSPCYQN